MSDDIIIVYNSTRIPAARCKCALYSTKFRQNQDYHTLDKLVINGKETVATFTHFMEGMQGQPSHITKKNCVSMLKLAREWEVSTMLDILIPFVAKNVDCDTMCLRILKGDAAVIQSDLENMLGGRLTEACELPSFRKLPQDTIDRIVAASTAVPDSHLSFDFVMAMFKSMGRTATKFVKYLDVAKLDEDQLAQLLDCPQLKYQDISDYMTDAAFALVKENRALRDKMGELEQTLMRLADQMQMYEECSSRDEQSIAALIAQETLMKNDAQEIRNAGLAKIAEIENTVTKVMVCQNNLLRLRADHCSVFMQKLDKIQAESIDDGVFFGAVDDEVTIAAEDIADELKRREIK